MLQFVFKSFLTRHQDHPPSLHVCHLGRSSGRAPRFAHGRLWGNASARVSGISVQLLHPVADYKSLIKAKLNVISCSIFKNGGNTNLTVANKKSKVLYSKSDMTKKCAARNQRLRHQNRCQKPETCKFRLICVPNLQRDSLLTRFSKSEMPWNHSVPAHQRIPLIPFIPCSAPPSHRAPAAWDQPVKCPPAPSLLLHQRGARI